MTTWDLENTFSIRDRVDHVFEQRHAARRCRCGHVSSDVCVPNECFSCGYSFPVHVPCPNCCAIISRIPDDRHRFCHTCSAPITSTTCEKLEHKQSANRMREEQALRSARRGQPMAPKVKAPTMVYVEVYKRVDHPEDS